MKSSRQFSARWMDAEWLEDDEGEIHFPPHCHDRYEIYCFFSGRADFKAEGGACQPEPGSVLLLDRSRFHSNTAWGEPSQPYRRLVLHLAPELLYPEERPLLELFRRPEILYPNAWQRGLQGRVQALERAALLPENVREIAIRTEMVGVLVELFAMSDDAVAGAQGEQGRIREVLDYINANLTGPLTLEGLAERFYMSRNSLARAFKRATGSTVPDYILYKRMALARILLQAGHPLGVAARECGYSDYSTFYRCYRKVFGQSPSEPLGDGTEPAPSVLAPAPDAL